MLNVWMILSFWEGENEKVKSADRRDFGTRAYIHRWIAIGYPYVRWGENIMNNTKQSTTTAAVSQTRWVDMQFLRCIVMNCLSTNKQTNNLYPIYKPFIQQLHLELILVDTYVVKGSKPSNPKFWVSRCVQFIWRYLFLLPAFLPLNKQ